MPEEPSSSLTPPSVDNAPAGPAPDTTPATPPTTPVAPAQPSPATPTPPAPVATDASQSPVAAASPSVGKGIPIVMKVKSRKTLLIAAIVAALVLLLGGGYVFGFYLPNTPENVYSAGMTNTGTLLDGLVSYSKDQESAHYQSASFDGTMKVASGSTSLDGSLTGSFDGSGNGSADLTADVMGQHVTVNLRSVHAAGNDSPDLYLQTSGLKSYLDSFGLGSLDGQWISVDHTIIDSYKNQLGASSDLAAATSAPTYAQIQDAIAKVQTVNKQYLFTGDSSKAVLTESKFVGQEQVSGRTSNHYKVGYNKANYVAYLGALGDALDSSQLNAWSKAANGGKNLSEVVDIAGAKQDAQNAKAGYTFDLWVDTGTRLVSKVSATNPDDASQVLTLTQGYTGGTSFPLTLGIKGNSDGTPLDMTISATLDTSSHKATLGIAGSETTGDGTTSIDLTVHATPSGKAVTVTAPAGATSLTDLLNQDFGATSTTDLSTLSL